MRDSVCIALEPMQLGKAVRRLGAQVPKATLATLGAPVETLATLGTPVAILGTLRILKLVTVLGTQGVPVAVLGTQGM